MNSRQILLICNFCLILSSTGGPPTCNTTVIGSSKQKNCSLTYGDGINHPISAIMTWTSNGAFYANDTPVRTKVGSYYVSKSSIIVNASDPADYQCTVTFAIPTNVQFAYVATNAPQFCATCTSSCEFNSKIPQCILKYLFKLTKFRE